MGIIHYTRKQYLHPLGRRSKKVIVRALKQKVNKLIGERNPLSLIQKACGFYLYSIWFSEGGRETKKEDDSTAILFFI